MEIMGLSGGVASANPFTTSWVTLLLDEQPIAGCRDEEQMAAQSLLSGWDVLTLAFSTGVVTAVLNNLLGWYRESKKERTTIIRDARYWAMQVAVILESFAMECANIIANNHDYSHSEGHAGTAHLKLPPAPKYPSDGDWRTLDPALSARALSLPNELSLSDEAIAFYWEIDPADQGALLSICSAQAGKSGYRAWQLAADMRHRYGLPEFKPEETAWDVVKTLKEEHDHEIKRLKEQQRGG
jgi:hypothetical protein